MTPSAPPKRGKLPTWALWAVVGGATLFVVILALAVIGLATGGSSKPKAGQITGKPIKVGKDPQDVAFTPGNAWVANLKDGTVTRIDTSTDKTRAIKAGGAPSAVAAARSIDPTTPTGRPDRHQDEQGHPVLRHRPTIDPSPSAAVGSPTAGQPGHAHRPEDEQDRGHHLGAGDPSRSASATATCGGRRRAVQIDPRATDPQHDQGQGSPGGLQ
jgi:hypothetical protein